MLGTRTRFFAVLASGMLGIVFSASTFAQNVRIPGTNVTIAPPPGFTVARGGRSLENTANGSSVVFQEMSPAAYPDMVELFSSPRAASQRYSVENTRIMRIDPLDVNGKQVPLAIGDQAAGRRTVTKYIALLGEPESNTNTLLVTFNVTDPSSLSRRDVEAAIRSITLGQLATLDDKLARLPFSFREAPPFRITDVLPNGSVMLEVPEAASPAAVAGARPIILIERANTTAAPAETAQFAEQLLSSVARGSSFEITGRETVPFAGGDGLYLTAAGGDVGVLQFLRVLSGGRYIVLAAVGEREALFGVRDAVEAIANSLQLK